MVLRTGESFPGLVVLPSNHQQEPCFITKVISCQKFYLVFNCYKEAYARFSNEMLMYFESKANLPYITMFDCSNENFILNSMFILKQNNEYFRVRVQEILPDNTFDVQFLDDGFHYIATDSELIFNDNYKFYDFPAQAFEYSLQPNRSLNNQQFYPYNYMFQSLVNTRNVKFFVTFSPDSTLVDLYFKFEEEMFNVNDYLGHFNDFLKKDASHNEIDETCRMFKENFRTRVPSLGGDGQISSTLREIFKNPKFELSDWLVKGGTVIDPGRFYLRLEDRDPGFAHFHQELQDYFNESTPIKAKTVTSKCLYVVQYENEWVRVYVEKNQLDTVGWMYSCWLIDRGLTGTVNLDELFELPARFEYFPAQSTCAALNEVQPEGGVWSDAATEFFRSLVENQTVTIFSNGYESEDYILQCNVVADEININDQMVRFEYAAYKDD